MTLYTNMPLELVLNGHDRELRRTFELRLGSNLVELEPVHPGIGRLVRLIDGPLDSYLRPELQPGSLIAYAGGESGSPQVPEGSSGGGMLP